MFDIVKQLSTYKSAHLNPTNIKTHIIGIPLIIWAILVLMSLLRGAVDFGGQAYEISLAMVFVGLVLLYYFALHLYLALGMLVLIYPVLLSADRMASHPQATWIALAVFVVGWIFQFIGHYYEKAKPAFFDDLKQLLIGPLFLLAELYFVLGWQKDLDEEITPLALEKRKALEAHRRSAEAA